MKVNRILRITLFMLVAIILTSCATTLDFRTLEPTNITYGFFGGLWHGIICIFGFIGRVLNPEQIQMYAKNNNGSWYDLGFLLGVSTVITCGLKAMKL